MTSQPYVYIWEYEVYPHASGDFRKHYGPDGSWVALFRRAPGYVGTQLYWDRDQPLRYVTIDTWESEAAYAEFRRQFAREYAELDQRCERFTVRETRIGHFELTQGQEGTV